MILLKISFISYMFWYLGSEGNIFAWYQKLIESLPDWIGKPLGKCYICLTGQVCLWYFLFTVKDYSLVEHSFFIAAGIFLSMVYHLIFLLLENLIQKYE